jgi:hypothetical protein
MITPEQYFSYFEAIAIASKDINHNEQTHKQFTCVDIDEIDESVFQNLYLQNWCMVLEDYSGRISGGNNESLQLTPDGAFLIFKHCPVGDRVMERQIISEAFDICTQIIAKMYKDMYEYNAVTNNNIMASFDPKTVSFEKLKAIHDNCFGYRFQWQFGRSTQLVYNANKWDWSRVL